MMREEVKMIDEISWIHRDKTGRIIKKYTSKHGLLYKLTVKLHLRKPNCLTNTGFAALAGLILVDIGGTAFDYLAIGTGTNVAAAANTTLQTEIKRKTGTGTRVTTTVTNDTAQLVTTFSSADGLSGTSSVTEVGEFNDPSAGTMLMRQIFTAESLNWDAGDSFEVTVKVQCKQGT